MNPSCFGRYILLTRLAAGGMGEIFVAVPRSLWGFDKFLAVKKILPHLSHEPEFLSRFKDEARLVIPMNHPNVVQVSEVGRVGREYFLAMELVEGKNIGQLLSRCWQVRKKRSISIPTALYIIRELLTGLDYCHSRRDGSGGDLGLVHRDVSPSNVMISYDGAVKLADFGLALSSEKCVQTNPNMVLGHIGYMSPESMEGKRVDLRADIFSTGVLLFELLTCQKFAPGRDAARMREELPQRCKLKPSQLRPDVPPSVDRIVARAIAVDPGARYPSAWAFRDDLQRALVEIDALFGARELSESVMHSLFHPHLDRLKLRSVMNSLDLEELVASQPASRTECLGEAIPVGDSNGRKPFGANLAVLTMLSDISTSDTSPYEFSNQDTEALERARKRKAGQPLRDNLTRIRTGASARRRRWLQSISSSRMVIKTSKNDAPRLAPRNGAAKSRY